MISKQKYSDNNNADNMKLILKLFNTGTASNILYKYITDH